MKRIPREKKHFLRFSTYAKPQIKIGPRRFYSFVYVLYGLDTYNSRILDQSFEGHWT